MRSTTGAYLISILMPMLVVLMAVFGAFYPAVDVTAGERERRCEETTLLVPAPRRGVWLGKVLAVSGLSLLATALNLAGIAFAANHMIAMVGANGLQVALSFRDVALALPLALSLVLFTSAVLTGLASLTRTFKQGQALLGGVQLAFLAPALVSTLPALALTPALAVTPVVGIALALRSVLRGGAVDADYVLALLAHLAYAGAAVWMALRLLGAELDTQDRTKPITRLLAAFSRRTS
jgi:sodium transport system permease protein